MGHAHEKRLFWQESNLVMLTAVCIYLTFGKIIWHQCRWGEQWREKEGQGEPEEKKLGYEQLRHDEERENMSVITGCSIFQVENAGNGNKVSY